MYHIFVCVGWEHLKCTVLAEKFLIVMQNKLLHSPLGISSAIQIGILTNELGVMCLYVIYLIYFGAELEELFLTA